MKPTRNELNAILDQVSDGIRSEEIDPKAVEAAAARVWDRIASERSSAAAAPAAEHIRGCDDFQSLVAPYLRGELTEARTLLFEDHTRECLPCRKALKEARAGRMPSSEQAPHAQTGIRRARSVTAQRTAVRWAVAAALVVGLMLPAASLVNYLQTGSAGATVQAANGPVYCVTDSTSRPAVVGDPIRPGERVVTARNATAVVGLADGSKIEMKERSAFSVSENGQGTTVRLDRGNLIVEAAKRRSGHLYVSTDDCLVSVTGTIFSVNKGTKGSRVSVVEGEVRLDAPNQERVLRAGEQASSHASVEAVPVADEIRWSRNADRYLAMLAEIAAVREEIDRTVPRPEARTSTRLLDTVPAGTVFYAALPNLGETLAESNRIMQERIKSNEALREWWARGHDAGSAAQLDRAVRTIQAFGRQLGPEIVVAAGMNDRGEAEAPLLLAELRDPANFKSFLDQQLASLGAGAARHVEVLVDPLPTAPNSTGTETLYVWIHGDLLAVSPSFVALRQLEASATPSPFASSPFYAQLADIYRGGAGLIVAADLERIIARATAEQSDSPDARRRLEAYRQLGLLSLQYFIVQQREIGADSSASATLTFGEQRTGIPSWLAAPGPMGALEFVSQDATAVAAFVVKEPTALVDDLFGFVQTCDPDTWKHFTEFEAEHGIDVRRDFAEPLGGEYAFAIDGPLLPTPSWKMVLEVHDPARLQQAFERLVDEVNRLGVERGKKGFAWEQAVVDGKTFYTLRSVDTGFELHYAFVGGYLIAAPSQALVDRAIRFRDAGVTILHAPRFVASLPADGKANFSALLYHDLSPLVAAASSVGLTEEQQKALASGTGPMLAYVYAEDNRIYFAASANGGPFGLSPASLLGLPGSFGLTHILGEAMGKGSK